MENRKRWVIAPLLVLALFISACQVTIDDVISSVEAAVPLLQAEGVDTKLATDVLDLARKFKTDPTAATLEACTIAFDKLTARAQQIANPTKRTAVLVALVAANITLQKLAQKYLTLSTRHPSDTRLGGANTRVALSKVAHRAAWRCRDASGGQYRDMEFCKAHPDTSVVETH